MSTTDICRSLIDYNDTLNRRLWQSIFTLSDEQFTAPFDYSHGSVCDQVVHLAGVEGRWLRGLKGDPGARSFNPQPAGFPTRQAAFDLWDPIARDLQSFVHQLDQAGLDAHPPGLYEPAWQGSSRSSTMAPITAPRPCDCYMTWVPRPLTRT